MLELEFAATTRGRNCFHRRKSRVKLCHSMNEAPAMAAWLEKSDGARVGVAGSLSIGRTPKNQVVLEDERVSRRHAIIHVQGEGEFWLVDLGSRNGTYLGERRVQQPIRLSDGDRIRIASFLLVFRQPSRTTTDESTAQSSQQTIAEVRVNRCWLLVADV